jgi:hypothetical protein
MGEQLELVFAVASEQDVVVVGDNIIGDELIDQVIGSWDSVRVLRISDLSLSPKEFHRELRRLGVIICPKCRRYRRLAKCTCSK